MADEQIPTKPAIENSAGIPGKEHPTPGSRHSVTDPPEPGTPPVVNEILLRVEGLASAIRTLVTATESKTGVVVESVRMDHVDVSTHSVKAHLLIRVGVVFQWPEDTPLPEVPIEREVRKAAAEVPAKDDPDCECPAYCPKHMNQLKAGR